MGDNDDSGDATIQLDTMSLDQLQQLQQREEGRLQALTNRYAQLRSAAVRLQQSCIAVRAVETTSQNNNDNDKNNIPIGLDEECSTKDDIRKDVFVPLTESVYVPGTISLLRPDDRDLLVELGTGFFVDKTSKETVELLERKMKIVDDNSVNVTQAVQTTRQNLESITMAMRGKLVEIKARQQGRIHQSTDDGN